MAAKTKGREEMKHTGLLVVAVAILVAVGVIALSMYVAEVFFPTTCATMPLSYLLLKWLVCSFTALFLWGVMWLLVFYEKKQGVDLPRKSSPQGAKR